MSSRPLVPTPPDVQPEWTKDGPKCRTGCPSFKTQRERWASWHYCALNEWETGAKRLCPHAVALMARKMRGAEVR